MLRSGPQWACLLLVLGCDLGSEPDVKASSEVAAPIWADPWHALDLLSDYVEALEAAAQDGSGGGIFVDVLRKLEASAGKREAAQMISPEFHRRYVRLLTVTTLIFKPHKAKDVAEIDAALSAFVTEVEGKPHTLEGAGLVELIGPISKEVVNLHMLVDDSKPRAVVRAKYFPSADGDGAAD